LDDGAGVEAVCGEPGQLFFAVSIQYRLSINFN
jgi:hypothetical protein